MTHPFRGTPITSASLIVQQPQGLASGLVLRMHGVGSSPQSMLGVACWFAARDANALVVSVASPEPSDVSNGLQWFSVRGVTEQNRQARVNGAMPAFVATVQHWQQVAGVDPQHTVVAGFSQGAIMALELTLLEHPNVMRVVSFAGRFANLPERKSEATVHLVHGSVDPVMPSMLAQVANARLLELGTEVTVDIVQAVGHEPHPTLLKRLTARLDSQGPGAGRLG
ncbi:esterase [Variovorax sp. dw_954]|uniref:esterase n=1 Tax=Variovorax sp. dw_954 TaxID=2720078 RepID=UPI001BD2D1E5|nr:esterase [Variovorax sp. dw_954]